MVSAVTPPTLRSEVRRVGIIPGYIHPVEVVTRTLPLKKITTSWRLCNLVGSPTPGGERATLVPAPTPAPFMLHLFAALAKKERALISELDPIRGTTGRWI
jgi:hypothetical protein